MTKKHFFALIVAGIATVALFGFAPKASAEPVVNIDGGSAEAFHVSAVLSGTINPRSFMTLYWFEFGTSRDNLNRRTQIFSVGFGISPVTVRHTITGLYSNTKYYFRLVARSAGLLGIRDTRSAIRYFTTISDVRALPATVIHRNQTLCHNGPSRTDSGDCGGIACMDLCTNVAYTDFTFAGQSIEACRDMARRTGFWGKYTATSEWTSSTDVTGDTNNRFSFGFEVGAVRNCSTADKCNADTCVAAALITTGSNRGSLLRAGNCQCGPGEVGGVYKICCRRAGGTYTEVAAARYHTQDLYRPEEGVCPVGATTYRYDHPLLAGRGLQCPIIDPVISLRASPSAISPGESTTLTWATTGLTDCRITRAGPGGEIGGLGNVEPDGSAPSDPRTLGTHIYTLNCGRIGNTADRLTSTATITVGARWWFCNNGVCEQTANPHPTAEACQSAVLEWRGINTTCHRERSDCEQGCVVVSPTPVVTCRAASATRMDIFWTNMPNETGYEILRCTDTGCTPTIVAGAVGPDVTVWTDERLNQNTIYRYLVRVLYPAGRIVLSNIAECRTLGAGACVINNFSATPNMISAGETVTLAWDTTRATGCSIAGIGEVASSGSRAVNPISTTTYTLNCNTVGGGSGCSRSVTVTVRALPPPYTPEPPSIISAHNDVIINNFSVNPTCIPQQPGNRREATLSWSVSIKNSCPPEPNNPPLDPPPSDGRCSPSSWTSGWVLTAPRPPYTASCTAFGGWSGNRPLSGSHNISPPPSFTTTYGLSCSRTDTYTCRYARSYSFQFWDCVSWTTCTSCTTSGTPPTTSCVSFPCCARFGCLSGSGSVSGVGPTFGPSSRSATQQLRVIQKPIVEADSLRTDPVRPQILLNHFINLVWRVNVPDSGVPTRMMCTPSIASGDGEGWTRGTGIPSILLDSLNPSGRRNNLSPNVTTRYQLFCRNRDAIDPNRCFNDSDIVSREVRVFTPDLREVPAFYDGFIRFVGRITDNLFR